MENSNAIADDEPGFEAAGEAPPKPKRSFQVESFSLKLPASESPSLFLETYIYTLLNSTQIILSKQFILVLKNDIKYIKSSIYVVTDMCIRPICVLPNIR